jgi:hypothetical protein
MTSAGVIRSIPWLGALVAGVLAQPGCGGDARPSPSYTKIDDMEGPGNLIQWTPPPGTMPAAWFTTTACAQLDRISPPPNAVDPNGWSYAELPAPHETLSGTVSKHAARLRTTSPLAGIWGAIVGFPFATALGAEPPQAGVVTDDTGACVDPVNDYPNLPVDLSAYAGVTFWARAESPGGRDMRVQVNDANTDPRGGVCQEADRTASDYCYNGFGAQIELTDTFRQYTLDFSTLTQRGGWGYRPPGGIDWSRVFTVDFEMDLPSCSASAGTMCPGGTPTLSFDIWLDDIYFLNR